MSRRKQSNPKPLLKSDCQESVDEMTVERDNKDFCDSNDDINEAPHGDIDNSEQFSSDSIRDSVSPTSPRSTTSNHITTVELTNRIQSPITTATSAIITKNNFQDNNITDDRRDGSRGEDVVVTAKTTAAAVATTTVTTVPKLRLNVSLASDPALKPDAKDIKIIRDVDDDDYDDDDDDDATTMQSLPTDEINSSYNKQNMETDIENEIHIHHSSKNNTTVINTTNNCNKIITGQVAKPLSIDVTTHRLKVFMCHPCGIGFSSHSTLEAHQKYYCSHRQETEGDASSNNAVISTTTTTSAIDKASSSTGEPITKSIKTGKQYACTQCSYSADKKVSLNRHMRMHQSSPTPSSNASNGEESSSQQVDRYCSECDIRFSNVKTYRAHKQHYCSSRRTEGQTPPKSDSAKKSGSVSPQARSKTPTAVAPPQPFLALPTNPILIIPYSIVRAASLLPGPLTSVTSGVANPDSTCFSFENGTLHPVATSLNTQVLTTDSTTSTSLGIQSTTHCNTVTPLLSEKNSRNSNNIMKSSSKKEGSSRETVPLDLSIRKSPLSFQKPSPLDVMATIGLSSSSSSAEDNNKLDIEAMMEGKENLSIVGGNIVGGKITPEQIVCSPSLPSSPSMSPSPKRRTISPRTISAISSSTSSPPGSNCLIDNPISSINTNIRPLLPSDLTLKFAAAAEANIATLPSLLSKQHIELALKLVNKPNESSTTVTNSSLLNLPSHGNPIGVVPPSIPNVQPQIYVKQGVSKCKECNIVFCKYENYLAHKQHYCSARNQDDNDVIKVNTPPGVASTGGGGINVVESSGVGGGGAGGVGGGIVNTSITGGTPGPVGAYHQLICAACGIKYTSLDNLRAHQTFYCPKGGDIGASAGGINNNANIQISVGKEKCNKCKIIHDINKQCPSVPISTTTVQGPSSTSTSSSSSSSSSSYKCPVCGVVSLSASDSKKHLETHGSVKAFRCSICQYKGNTLRGMRTHIRMHFDKKSSDFNEENYMSCILEEETVEIKNQAAHAVSGKNINKNNVIRHIKLGGTGPPSNLPEVRETDEISTHNGDTNKMISKENVHIKEEPLSDIHRSISSRIKIEPDDSDTEMITISSSNAPVTTAFSSSSSSSLVPSSLLSTTIMPIQSLSPEDNVENQLNIQKSTTSPSPLPPGSNGHDNSKYCRNCDIKFTYINTYIAHKQFYCKSDNNKTPQQQRGEIKTPPSPVQLSSSTTTLDNSNKNKENVEKVL